MWNQLLVIRLELDRFTQKLSVKVEMTFSLFFKLELLAS